MPDGKLRFGVTDGEGYSTHWVVWAARRRAEVVVSHGRLSGEVFHLSLHDPAYGYHVRANDHGTIRHLRHPYPDQVEAGVRQFMMVHVPSWAVGLPRPARPERVAWTVLPAASDLVVTFSICIEEQGALTSGRWPGQPEGTELVGRLPMADGSTLSVVRKTDAIDEIRIPLPMSSETAAATEEAVASGRGMMLFGLTESGATWVLDAPPQRFVRKRDDP